MAGYAAPIEVTVVPTVVAKLTVQPPKTPLKLGSTAELTVKVERLADYTGEFEITLTLPKDTKGVTLKGVTIPTGNDEIKLLIDIADDAKIGTLSNVIVQATATLHGKVRLYHEAKLNLNIVK